MFYAVGGFDADEHSVDARRLCTVALAAVAGALWFLAR
jgi:hypothetical protein